MQAIKLARHVKNPIISAGRTPNFYLICNVKNTFTIYPIYGNIKVRPASLPIQVEDKLAWIIYRTYAVVPSNARPNTSKGKAYEFGLVPKIATKSCPIIKKKPDPKVISSAWVS